MGEVTEHGNGLTTEQRRSRSVAAWERRRAAGEVGWTAERRAKFRATMAVKYPKGDGAARLRAAIVLEEMGDLRAQVADLLERVAALEARPVAVALAEWRPDHRRHADGGKPVRAQRRDMGLPKRPRAVA